MTWMLDRTWRLGIVFFFGLALSGCASTRWAPPSDTVREQLGAVALVASTSTQGAPSGPKVTGRGKGALVGFGQGFLGVLAADTSYDPLTGALALLLAPPAGVIGAVVGASNARSAAEARATDGTLRAALDAEQSERELAREVVAATVRRAPERRIEIFDRAQETSSYEQLQSQGYASVLELSLAYGFQSQGTISPDVTLDATVDARLILLASGTTVYERRWRYVGESHNYFRLAEDDAELLRGEFELMYSRLAETIIHDLFVAEKPDRDKDSRVRTVLVNAAQEPVQSGP